MSQYLQRLNIASVEEVGVETTMPHYTQHVNVVEVVDSDGNPWEPVPGRGSREIPVRVSLPEEKEPPRPVPEATDVEPQIRRVRITRDDVIRIGYTVGCPGRRSTTH